MRRRVSILAVAAIAAATLGAAAPAKAAEADVATHCQLLMRTPDIVEIGPGVITIYPSNVGPYVNHVIAAANSFVNCIVNETTGPVLACAATVIANRPTVTIDINTLAITIDYSALLGTRCTL
ncbi:MAG TPA: hypothetical protein VG318_00865 [Actinomycetota bacterium]|nr:hypothetical protein [Actinomycetota bacterium]